MESTAIERVSRQRRALVVLLRSSPVDDAMRHRSIATATVVGAGAVKERAERGERSAEALTARQRPARRLCDAARRGRQNRGLAEAT